MRSARRPAGWQAPGPLPAGPGDRADLWPTADEDLCFLSGDWRIFQRLDGHRWSLDDLATAWVAAGVAAPRPPSRHLDLGCGIGSVLMMIAWRFPQARCLGVEAQRMSAEMARRSLVYNGAADRVEVVEGDLRDATWRAGRGGFELITGTPPYIPIGHGVVSQRPQCGPCRHETRGGIEAYCEAAAAMLADNGHFVVCEGADQIARSEAAAERAGLAIESRLDIVPKEGKAALLSVYVMSKRPDASRVVCPPLVVRDRSGARTTRYTRMRTEMGLPP